MKRLILFIVFSLSLFTNWKRADGNHVNDTLKSHLSYVQDIPSDLQLLLNGRIWWNAYSRAVGHQFFATSDYLTGDLTFEGRKYRNLTFRYDIIHDELLLALPLKPVVILNKEMVDSFTLRYNNRIYKIVNMGSDSSEVRGYVNVLYEGNSALYVKYIKEIQPLASEGKYDRIIEKHKIFVRIDSAVVRIAGKGQLLELLSDRKKELKEFERKQNYIIGRRDPYTFVPLLEYYDSLREK